MKDKGAIVIIEIGQRYKREFISGEARESVAGKFIFGEMPMIPIEQLGPGMDQFGCCPEWDFILRVDGRDATTHRVFNFRQRVVEGIERESNLDLFCPHTGESWEVRFKIIPRPDKA